MLVTAYGVTAIVQLLLGTLNESLTLTISKHYCVHFASGKQGSEELRNLLKVMESKVADLGFIADVLNLKVCAFSTCCVIFLQSPTQCSMMKKNVFQNYS